MVTLQALHRRILAAELLLRDERALAHAVRRDLGRLEAFDLHAHALGGRRDDARGGQVRGHPDVDLHLGLARVRAAAT